MTKLEKLYERQDWLDANVLCPYNFKCNNEHCKGVICKERKEYMANQQAIKKIENKAQHRWVIADTHFFHTNIINYCNRPYENVKKMNADIIKRWNSVVGKDDLVYLLGDFALMHGDKNNVEQIMHMLNGRVILIMGNHDSRKPRYYLDIGFLQATRKPILVDEDVVLSHEPINVKKISKDLIYLFGHVHDKMVEQDDLRNCFCVSAERLNYIPYDLDKLIKAIRDGKKLNILKELKDDNSKN